MEIQGLPLHKKTLVNKGLWLKFGDWYIDPNFNKMPLWTIPYKIAHRCADGGVYGLYGPGHHKSKRTGRIKIYGKCRKCKAPVGEELHIILNILNLY